MKLSHVVFDSKSSGWGGGLASALHKDSVLLFLSVGTFTHPFLTISYFFAYKVVINKKNPIIWRTSTQPSGLLIRDVYQVQVCFSSIMGRKVLTNFELFDC